ncbi:MAG: NTP transferase domain-containing protein, partial [Chloroflexi bacterium]|nr:NTP transferase domain-containing protein [Chloroflexota bacterium]
MPVAAPIIVILAGGSNSRFWPLRAKSLLQICGRTLIERHIDAFIAAGCRRFVIVSNAETLEETRAAVSSVGADVALTIQAEPRGMGDAVLTAAAALPELEREPFVVSQAHDVVEPALYQRFLAAASASVGGGLMAAKRVAEYFPGGYLTLDGDRVTGLVEKPAPGEEPSDLVSFVLHLHRRPGALLDHIRAAYTDLNPGDDHYERAVAALLPTVRYDVLPYEGPWQPIKYPWHVLSVMEMALSELSASTPLPESVSGPVVLEEGVRIFPGARIVGPAWIGAGSIIGNNSLVRGSMLGRHVEVGYGCEVARSAVGDNCTLHHNYVGDSVIDRNVGLGFGTVTGNWPFYPPPVRSTAGGERLRTGFEKFGAIVGADSRTGIGVLLNPGVKVGARSFVGPGVVVA